MANNLISTAKITAVNQNYCSESSSITVLGIKELLPKLHNRPLPFYTHTYSTYEWSAHRLNVVFGYIYYVYCRRDRQYFLNEHHFSTSPNNSHKNFFGHPYSLPNEKNNNHHLPPPPPFKEGNYWQCSCQWF